jgi:uncharacterized membrane protein YphA (DoxX/SURF4 family)
MAEWKDIKAWFDDRIGKKIRNQAIPILRISLGLVYFWFGLLKVFNVSPIAFIIRESYDFLPYPLSLIFLGIWETLIGLALIFKKWIRTTVISLWFQMLGIFGSIVLAPHLFYQQHFLIPTLEGEFVIKNLIIIAASLVVIGYKSHPTINT